MFKGYIPWLTFRQIFIKFEHTFSVKFTSILYDYKNFQYKYSVV